MIPFFIHWLTFFSDAGNQLALHEKQFQPWSGAVNAVKEQFLFAV